MPSASADLFSILRARWDDGGRLALVTPAGRRITYGGIVARTAQIAHALVRAGVKPTDRVAVQVEKSPDAILLYLACLRAGAVYLPLNTAYTPAELDYFIADAEPALFVCAPSAVSEIEALCARGAPATRIATLDDAGGGSLIEMADAEPADFDQVPRGSDDLAAILYTSGTTGRSKGAMLTHGNLASNALTLTSFWDFTRDDVLIHALPIFHTHGLFVATNVVLAASAQMIFLAKFDPDAIVREMARATVLMGVPTFYVRLLQEERLTRETTRNMRLFISGSAPLLAGTHVAFSERTGHKILERYGMTETNMNTSNPYRGGARRPGSVGPPLPGVEVRICDPDTGAPLPEGEIGMIEVRGPNVFKGYWRMPDKTRAEFRDDGYFITGDLGVIDAAGYVSIAGRGKDLIITGGYNVYPREVESEIDSLPGVRESAVIGLPHGDLGEAVTAIVVAHDAALDEAALRAALSPRLAKFKQPKRVLFVSELPRNTMGKVQKAVLRETYGALYAEA